MTKDQRRVMEPAKLYRIHHPAMLLIIQPRPSLISSETRFTAPLREYQKPILRTCSSFVYHLGVTSMYAGNSGSDKTKEEPVGQKPAHEVYAGAESTTAPQRKQMAAHTFTVGSFWPRIAIYRPLIDTIILGSFCTLGHLRDSTQ